MIRRFFPAAALAAALLAGAPWAIGAARAGTVLCDIGGLAGAQDCTLGTGFSFSGTAIRFAATFAQLPAFAQAATAAAAMRDFGGL